MSVQNDSKYPVLTSLINKVQDLFDDALNLSAENANLEIVNISSKLNDIASLPSGVTTLLLQEFFDNVPNNTYIKFPRVTYNLDNVIVISNKKHLKIDCNDATFQQSKHGYGIFEITNSCSNIKFYGGELLGAGSFPVQSFDGATLHNEKYDNIGVWGFHRNGSLTTTAAYNGGNLGNCGIGLLIHKGCKNIKVSRVTTKYFNYVGIAVGFIGDGNDINTSVLYNENISIKDCNTEENFDAGIHIMATDGFEISGNTTLNNGHPSATSNDTTIDPGYGVTCRGAYYHAKNGIIEDNYSKGNKRKGLDSHACENVDFINNKVFDSFIGGIIVTIQGTYTTKNYRIEGNWIENCGNSQSTEGNQAILADGDTLGKIINNTIINCVNANPTSRYTINAPKGKKIIEDNTIMDSGATVGIYCYTQNPFIKNNKFFDTLNVNATAIWVASGSVTVDYTEIEDNYIKSVGNGIRFENIVSGIFDRNKVDVSKTALVCAGTNNLTVGSKNKGIDWTTVTNIVGMSLEPEIHVVSITITSGVVSFSHKSGNIVSSIVNLDKGITVNLNKNVKYSSIDVCYKGSSDRNNFPNIYYRANTNNTIDVGLGNTITSVGVPMSGIAALSIDLIIKTV